MWAAMNFQLHHDNAPAHSAHVVHAYLDKNSMSLVRQAHCSPDLARCDLAVPQAKNNFEREAISIKRKHIEKIDGGAWERSGGGV